FRDPLDHVLLAAAVGDYHKADLYLEEMERRQERGTMENLLRGLRGQTFQSNRLPLPPSLMEVILSARSLTDQADLLVLRGIFAVEAGDTERAARYLRQGLERTVSPMYGVHRLTPLAARSPLEVFMLTAAVASQRRRPMEGFGTQRVADRYLQLLREAGHPR